MSEPDTKRPKLDADAFELVYWPGLPGRGEVVRLLFEEAGVPFNDLANDPKIAVETVVGLIGKDNKGDASNPPVLAPPILRHGKLTINQLPNILLYLAPKIGLAPSPSEGDAIFHLNQITLTILDGLLNEVHDTHHPISTGMYYADQKEEAKKRSDGYTKERIPKFFAYLQRLLDAKTSGDGPWLYGGKLTYVDLVLFQCLDGTQYAFPKAVAKAKESGEYKGVFELYDAVKERPNIKAYLESDRRRKYAEGIWRHYPELED